VSKREEGRRGWRVRRRGEEGDKRTQRLI